MIGYIIDKIYKPETDCIAEEVILVVSKSSADCRKVFHILNSKEITSKKFNKFLSVVQGDKVQLNLNERGEAIDIEIIQASRVLINSIAD